ncbi:hypothetical protein BAX97_11755 [Elizabethkingia meningoseptica]|uniref:hypothetical protein n=2 Tax=Elizabethkingia meningoseptica TaxID=238 RepID=UPI00036ED679|nr:hypothetical protein [Elizabethkingia meningoseptica]AQX03834.1 hypothetical protein BBD33_00590 [Elizabethkingia meningoseptica]AQX45873.1 hypothetical protein B5G46_00590 [Elizabethkingia meningoseptica]KUY15166.1 hypothetical protein ATB99_11785 [Elizabethkingia meningoseptica]MDE5488626.1 hypothetical protein [Elizabethkingia meningoseptica]MVW92579.1 hypothetical protein [Elizabethkingia meningoseptica]
MKKYLFLSLMTIAGACSSSDNRDETKKEEEKTCNCNSQLFSREQRIDKNEVTISDTGWKETGNNTPYSKKCDDHNKVYGGSTSTTSYPGGLKIILQEEYRVKCY